MNEAPDGHLHDALTAQRVDVGLRSLTRLLWDGARRNKKLVAGVLFLGLLEAFFTKAPLLLVKYLMDVLAANPAVQKASGGAGTAPELAKIRELTDGFRVWLERSFDDFCEWINRIGLGLESEDMAKIVGCSVAGAILGLLGSVAIYGTTVYSRYFAAKIVVDLRNDVLQHILSLPMRFFSKRRMGDLISNITTDTTVLTRSFTLACSNVVSDPLSIAFNFLLLLWYVPEISWVLLLAVPLMAIPMLRTGRKIHRSSSRSLAAMGDSTESMNQMLTGIRTVKSFQLETERLREYQDFNSRFLERTKRMLKAKGFSQGFLFASYQISFAALLAIMGWLILYHPEEYSLPVITMAILPLATTYQHVKRIARSYNILCESVGAMEGVESILRVDPDVAHSSGGLTLDHLRGDVAMEHVSFAYDAEKVLHDVSFRVAPGQTVALVGPSGAGKSTAMDLLARFYDTTSGRVLVDGHDVRELDLRSYRRHVAMVSQVPFLFNTTILENIRYGNRSATDEEIFEAARRAHIHDFIVSQPKGYQTVVGEQGTNLSGGQRQRITIARAILRDPRILFLDEATSALDSEIEMVVQQALGNLMAGRTSFVIAHRLSTIQSADLILVMASGRLVEQGTHDALIRQGGLYTRLYELQQL